MSVMEASKQSMRNQPLKIKKGFKRHRLSHQIEKTVENEKGANTKGREYTR
jgi:hypothetical protein